MIGRYRVNGERGLIWRKCQALPLQLQLTRVLPRAGLNVSMARPVLDRVNLVSIGGGILRFAAAMELHVKSLDAIHLGTIGLLGSGIAVVTRDDNMAEIAARLGLEVIKPLSD